MPTVKADRLHTNSTFLNHLTVTTVSISTVRAFHNVTVPRMASGARNVGVKTNSAFANGRIETCVGKERRKQMFDFVEHFEN
jgi:hypothetical protein